MYRLNCLLPDRIGEELGRYSERYGYTKVAMVTEALTMYFKQKELAQRVLDSVASDPAKLAQLVSVLGSSDAGLDSVFSDGLSDGSAG